MHINLKFLAVATFVCSTTVPSWSEAADLTLQQFIGEAAPIESTIQGCYGHISFYELTDEERLRLDDVSGILNNLVNRFATNHTIEAYETVNMEFVMTLVEMNRNRPVVVCDLDLIAQLEKRTQAVIQRYKSVKGPYQR